VIVFVEGVRERAGGAEHVSYNHNLYISVQKKAIPDAGVHVSTLGTKLSRVRTDNADGVLDATSH
jgi:hypothetical protein